MGRRRGALEQCARHTLSRHSLIGSATPNIVDYAGSMPVNLEEESMSWKTPKVIEVSLALEINSYVSAEIG